MTGYKGRAAVPAGTAGRQWLDPTVTLVWFIVWLICNTIGDKEPLTFDPVNWWAGLLLLAVALDLGGGHARRSRR
jgi:hypothetical protein